MNFEVRYFEKYIEFWQKKRIVCCHEEPRQIIIMIIISFHFSLHNRHNHRHSVEWGEDFHQLVHPTDKRVAVNPIFLKWVGSTPFIAPRILCNRKPIHCFTMHQVPELSTTKVSWFIYLLFYFFFYYYFFSVFFLYFRISTRYRSL